MARIPVIIGIGEYVDRPAVPEQGLEPLALIEQAARRAEADAGGRWLHRLDTLRVVQQISWPYRDLPALLARRLRARTAEPIYGPVGGEAPLRMLVEAAEEIAAGDAEVAMLCGGEALKTMMALRGAGSTPDWQDPDPSLKLPVAEDFVSRQAARYGLINPIEVYPLYDNATRAAWGQDLASAQRESAVIWAGMSRVAAENPHAWSGRATDADAILTAGPRNRMVAHPYPKLMTAQIGVNQAAAVLVTHRDAALAMGIAESRLIYIGAGAGGNEPGDFLRRDRYDHAPALEAAIRRTLELNALTAADIDLVELYSCFPCVPKLARRVLGLPAEAPLSVTGGLTFFGGPGNNYMTHAIAAMVRALREGRGRRGLLHGNGEFVTKHHALVLGRQPPAVTPRNENLQPALDAAYGEVPPLIERHAGPCHVETYTVTYSAKGLPTRGMVIARTPAGERFLARVDHDDAATLAFLTDGAAEPVGASLQAWEGNDGLVHVGLQAPAALPPPALLFEMLAPHVARVTLNRPQRRNAVDGALTRLMVDAVARIEADPEIRVAILDAAGDEAFCAGADLGEVAAGRNLDLIAGGNGFAGFVNAARGKPWIAAVRGAALGGGTELALACDLVVAGRGARFGLPEVARSLIAAAGGVYRLVRALPPRRAMELVLTGEAIDAEAAARLGLVNRLVDDAAVLEAALELAQRIAANAPLAVQATRRLAAAAFDATDAELATRSVDAVLRLMGSEDAREGPRAFLEKRPPRWTGR